MVPVLPYSGRPGGDRKIPELFWCTEWSGLPAYPQPSCRRMVLPKTCVEREDVMRTSVSATFGLIVLAPLACAAGPDPTPAPSLELPAAEPRHEHTEEELYGGWSGRQANCAYLITSWEAGETQEVIGAYGDRAADVVETCRLILESSNP